MKIYVSWASESLMCISQGITIFRAQAPPEELYPWNAGAACTSQFSFGMANLSPHPNRRNYTSENSPEPRNNWRIEVTEVLSKTSPRFLCCDASYIFRVRISHLAPLERCYWMENVGGAGGGGLHSFNTSRVVTLTAAMHHRSLQRTRYWIGNSTYNDIGTIFLLNFTLHLHRLLNGH